MLQHESGVRIRLDNMRKERFRVGPIIKNDVSFDLWMGMKPLFDLDFSSPTKI